MIYAASLSGIVGYFICDCAAVPLVGSVGLSPTLSEFVLETVEVGITRLRPSVPRALAGIVGQSLHPFDRGTTAVGILWP